MTILSGIMDVAKAPFKHGKSSKHDDHDAPDATNSSDDHSHTAGTEHLDEGVNIQEATYGSSPTTNKTSSVEPAKIGENDKFTTAFNQYSGTDNSHTDNTDKTTSGSHSHSNPVKEYVADSAEIAKDNMKNAKNMFSNNNKKDTNMEQFNNNNINDSSNITGDYGESNQLANSGFDNTNATATTGEYAYKYDTDATVPGAGYAVDSTTGDYAKNSDYGANKDSYGMNKDSEYVINTDPNFDTTTTKDSDFGSNPFTNTTDSQNVRFDNTTETMDNKNYADTVEEVAHQNSHDTTNLMSGSRNDSYDKDSYNDTTNKSNKPSMTEKVKDFGSTAMDKMENLTNMGSHKSSSSQSNDYDTNKGYDVDKDYSNMDTDNTLLSTGGHQTNNSTTTGIGTDSTMTEQIKDYADEAKQTLTGNDAHPRYNYEVTSSSGPRFTTDENLAQEAKEIIEDATSKGEHKPIKELIEQFDEKAHLHEE